MPFMCWFQSEEDKQLQEELNMLVERLVVRPAIQYLSTKSVCLNGRSTVYP